jgi:hypothetical protein
MEYSAYVIPAFLPVEHDLLSREFGMQNFFSTCSLICDAFRQEGLVTGDESWDALEAYCLPIVEKHSKACKSRQRVHQEQFPIVKSQCLDILEIPYIVPYAHSEDYTNCIMASEMAFLGFKNSKDSFFYNAVATQRTIHTHQLPPSLAKLQLKALSDRMRVCERSALSGSILYVCVSCVMANQQTICRKGRAFPTRGQCKYDLKSEDLVCSICQCHSIVSISTFGRIVSLRNYRFYLAPCCGTVQIYTGRGDEFQAVECTHKQTKAVKTLKKRCELCSNIAVDMHSSVDHLSGEQHHTHLCQRHTPHADALKNVTNWTQLQEEIRKRDRPLFSIRSYKKLK